MIFFYLIGGRYGYILTNGRQSLSFLFFSVTGTGLRSIGPTVPFSKIPFKQIFFISSFMWLNGG